MTYHEYIFRIPQDAPDLDYASLNTWLGERGQRKIGTTVTIVALDEHETAMGPVPASFEIWLYETLIARIYPDRVDFPSDDDPHQATSAWLAKIIYDNGLGSNCFRIRRHKSDGPGPYVERGRAGLLVIDGDRDKPVFGRYYPVNHERIAANRDWRERWAAEMAFRNAHPDKWAVDLDASGPGHPMPDYRDRVDPRIWQGTRHQPDLADIR